MKRLFIYIGILLATGCNRSPANAPAASSRLLIGDATSKPVKAGETGLVEIPITIEKGFHIQSNPASQKRLIPTTLKFEVQKEGQDGASIERASKVKFHKVQYPSPIKFRLKGAKEDIDTYEGEIVLKAPFKADGGAAVGKTLFQGKLRYQACNEHTCYFPKTQTFNVPITISK